MQIQEITAAHEDYGSTVYTVHFKYDGLTRRVRITAPTGIDAEDHADILVHHLEKELHKITEERVGTAVHKFIQNEKLRNEATLGFDGVMAIPRPIAESMKAPTESFKDWAARERDSILGKGMKLGKSTGAIS
jgi:hypothetical protein